MTHATTAAEYVKRWDANETVTSISMAGKGMGEGYEAAIQDTAIIFLRVMLEHGIDLAETDEDKIRKAWSDIEALVDKHPDFDGGITGVMYGAARSLATHFYRKGPAAVMTEEVVADRHILVSNAGGVEWLTN